MGYEASLVPYGSAETRVITSTVPGSQKKTQLAHPPHTLPRMSQSHVTLGLLRRGRAFFMIQIFAALESLIDGWIVFS